MDEGGPSQIGLLVVHRQLVCDWLPLIYPVCLQLVTSYLAGPLRQVTGHYVIVHSSLSHGSDNYQGRRLEGAQTASICLPVDHFALQNTEDEVLKAAIAKYGKNQWFVDALTRIPSP